LDFQEFVRNSFDISKGLCKLGRSEFESSEVSQPVRRLETLSSVIQERPAYSGLLRIRSWSPDSEFDHFRLGIADSLRPIFEKFPF
jgi:hypothetical protein